MPGAYVIASHVIPSQFFVPRTHSFLKRAATSHPLELFIDINVICSHLIRIDRKFPVRELGYWQNMHITMGECMYLWFKCYRLSIIRVLSQFRWGKLCLLQPPNGNSRADVDILFFLHKSRIMSITFFNTFIDFTLDSSLSLFSYVEF